MASTNKVFIKGNLGRDPELRNTQNGRSVCWFSLATNEKWTQDGERIQHTEWHRVVAFGRQAEVAQRYLAKGSDVIVWGRIRTRKFTDQDDAERSITEIHADELEFIGARRSDGPGPRQDREPSTSRRSRPSSRSQPQSTRRPEPAAASGEDEEFFEDDVPF